MNTRISRMCDTCEERRIFTAKKKAKNLWKCVKCETTTTIDKAIEIKVGFKLTEEKIGEFFQDYLINQTAKIFLSSVEEDQFGNFKLPKERMDMFTYLAGTKFSKLEEDAQKLALQFSRKFMEDFGL